MIDWLACALVRVLGWVCCHLPPSLCVWVGTRLGRLGYFLQPKRSRIGYLNLKAAFGERFTPRQSRQLVHRVFGNLGAALVEMLRLPAVDAAYIDRYIEIAGRTHFDAAVASGRPVLLLTGHFGNWELCSITAALKGYPITALARAQDKLPKLYELLVSYRESKGCRIVHKGGAMRQLVQALEQRQLVGIVGDQVSRQGIFVNFFGRPALFATGPFDLAHSTNALVLPAFLHRRRGPSHRLVLEPPIDLSKIQGNKDEVIRCGIEQFAGVLARHIEEDPAQWLWLHKRWKHTPARRALVLSDGKLGHVKQSLTVLRALKEQSPSVQERPSTGSGLREVPSHVEGRVVEVRYRNQLCRAVALIWAWLVPQMGALAALRLALAPACFKELTGCYADLIISCGASTAPVNVLLSSDLRAKSIVIMNPSPIPLSRFTLALVPVHDRVPARRNILKTVGALSAASEDELRSAREQLTAHPRFRPALLRSSARQPVIVVLFGGDSDEYAVTVPFAEDLLQQVLAVCEEMDGVCFVTTSRRTQSVVEQRLADRLTAHPRCPLLLLASRDKLNGTIAGMLGWADVIVVTGESVSMVSEACASGRHVVVVEPPLRRDSARATKPRRLLETLVAEGYVHHHPLPELSHAIRQCLSGRAAVRRLDTYAAVRDTVARLL